MASLSCVGKIGCSEVNISCISRNLFRCSGIPIRLTQPTLEIYTDMRIVKFIEANNNINTQNKRSRRGVVDKPLVLYPGVPSSIPDSSSLLDETPNPGPVSILPYMLTLR